MPLSLVVPATVTVRRPAAGVKRGLHDTGEDRRRLGGGAHGQVQAGVETGLRQYPPPPSLRDRPG